MKSQDTWFSEYAVSHQNQTNQKIHYICVPLIFWSIVGLLVSIPSKSLGIENPYLGNWAIPVLGLAMIFYFLNLKLKNSILMLVFALLCIAFAVWVSKYVSLWKLSLAVFVIAWIGQFYGHKLEGAKPSFLEDLQFLLIGPAWVFEKMTR